MPTYIVTAPQGRLSAAQKTMLAEEITRVHCEITGAPSYFAQVIFHDIPARQVLEFGKILPLPGEEAAWFDAIPDHIQQRIRDLLN